MSTTTDDSIRFSVGTVSVSPVDGLKEWMGDRSKRDAYPTSDEGKAAKQCTPVFRLWCNVEIAAAYTKNIPIVIKGTTPPI